MTSDFLTPDSKTLFLRRAEKSDCDLLFKWANEASTRENSFNNQPISFEHHLKWFEEKLSNTRVFIYIAYSDLGEIGQVRIEQYQNVGMINYSIDPAFRGKGYGFELLSALKEPLKQDAPDIRCLCGKVKFSNIASQKCFEKLGYAKSADEDYLIYTLDI